MNRRRTVIALSSAAMTAVVAVTATALLAPANATAQPVELAGVRYPANVTVGGSNLVLNGAGIRYRFVVKVYTAGLYLTGKATTPEAALAMPGPKRIHIVMLRDIDANELGRLFARGMQDNSPKEEFSRTIAGTMRMADVFLAQKKLAAGENFGVDWVPGVGTTVMINGKPQGEAIREPEFFSGLLRIWLGPNAADRGLKEALLGQAARPVQGTPGQQ